MTTQLPIDSPRYTAAGGRVDKRRMRLLFASARKMIGVRLPNRSSTTTPCGRLSWAATPAMPSPLKPGTPVPASVHSAPPTVKVRSRAPEASVT